MLRSFTRSINYGSLESGPLVMFDLINDTGETERVLCFTFELEFSIRMC